MFDLTHWSLESALRSVLLIALTAWVGWWVLSLLVAVIDRRTAARFGPPLLRAVLVGGALAATLTPAHAEQSSPVRSLDGLQLPERPVTGSTAAAAPNRSAPAAKDPPQPAHVVRAGDSLWSIARARDSRASDDALAATVARWYAANHDVIGPNPDLIQPGQRLVPPGAP